MSGRSRSVDRSAWRQLLKLGKQLLAQPAADTQRQLILEAAVQMVGGQASLWLAEPLHRLPGLEKPSSLSPDCPSDLMRQALDSQRMVPSEVETGAARAVAVPLVAQDMVLGVLEVERTAGLPFTGAEVELLDGLATQATSALQVAHQVAVERRRVEQLSLVRSVSALVAGILDLDALLSKVVTLIHKEFGYPFVYLFTVDPAREKIVYRAGSVPPEQIVQAGDLACSLLDSEGIVSWVACHGEPVLSNDVSQDPRYRPLTLPPAETRSELAMPLTFGDQVLGVLDVQSDRGDAFGDDDRTLFQALADSVAVAIRNANLYRSEQWRRQVADSLREVAGLLSADVAVDHVLDAILIELERTLPCDVAAIWLLHDDDLTLSAVRGCTADALAGDSLAGTSSWLTNALDVEQPIVRNPHAPPEPLGAALKFPPDYSAIAAPLRAGDRRLGVLTMAHRTPGRYGAASRMITSAFASYAAVAIENTRLYQEAQEQAWVATVMLQVAETTQSLTTLDQVLEAVVRLAPMLVGVDRCALLLWDEPAGAFVPAAAYGLSTAQQAAFDRWRIPTGTTPALDLLRIDQAPIVIDDTAVDPRLIGAHIPGFDTGPVLLLPLLAHGEAVGAMLCGDRSGPAGFDVARPFRDQRLAIIQGIAHQTAAAVESARLLEAQQEEAYVSAALLQVAQAVVSSSNLDDILGTIVRIVPMLVGVTRCAIFLWDEAQACFFPTQAYGVAWDKLDGLMARRYAPGDLELLDAVRECDRPVVYPPGETVDGSGAPDGIQHDPAADLLGNPQHGPRSLLAVPLSVKGGVLGVMVLEETEASHRSRERRLEIITGIGQQAALAVQNDRFQKEMAERERLERELQLAHEIQQTFMPSQSPDLPGWELAFTWRAARQVAGDFYDFFELPGGRLGLVIADVADKGMPAALFMALTRTLMRAAALEEVSPAAALARVNGLLVPDAHHGMFVTAMYAVLALATGELTYANAGHNLPFLWRSGSERLERLAKGGIALGVLDGIGFDEHVATLERGDTLVFFTDGITEAFSLERDMYGEDRLGAVVRATGGGSAQTMLDAIDGSVTAFVGEAPHSDDRTLMVVRRLK